MSHQADQPLPPPRPAGSHPLPRLDREQVAELEIGHTTLTRPLALALLLLCLATVFSETIVEAVHRLCFPASIPVVAPINPAYTSNDPAPPPSTSPFDRYEPLARLRHALTDPGLSLLARGQAVNQALQNITSKIEDKLKLKASLTGFLRSKMQNLLLHAGATPENVVLGRDGWLFFKPEVYFVAGPGFLEPDRLASRSRGQDPGSPDPRIAMIRTRDFLAQRGITLILVPIPAKPTIHPEMLAPSCAFLSDTAPTNSSFAPCLRDLGVIIFDPTDILLQVKDRSRLAHPPDPAPLFLRADSHWRPEAMEEVAQRLASFVRDHGALPPSPPSTYRRTTDSITLFGDLFRMCNLPPGQTLFRPETVTVHPVQTENGAPWTPTPSADILLLGDSYSMIYSAGLPQSECHAGFAEQLSFYLQRPLDVRHCWLREPFRASPGSIPEEALAGKKLVIWERAERYFSLDE